MEGFRVLVNDLLLNLASQELKVLGAVCAVTVLLTAVFVAAELRKNSGGDKDD